MIEVKFNKKYQKLIDSDLSNAEKLQKILDDTVEYYSEDSNKRCIGPTGCVYDGDSSINEVKTKGCAIGRLLKKQSRKDLDELDDSIGVGHWSDKINWGGFIAKNRNVLSYIQTLHDRRDNWKDNGLSEEGLNTVEQIKTLINQNE